jgi:transcriptional regulator with XRE-family HTH domain
MTDDEKVIAARLREAREFLGLSQADVAGALDVPRTSVSALETGTRKVTGLELRRLARLYRRPVAWLLGDDAELDGELLAATRLMSATDKAQVLRFAEFLAGARSAESADAKGATDGN